MSKYLKFNLILLIFVMALTLRFVGIDWDQGHHLHPDERFLTMVSSDIKFPNSIVNYFRTSTSPLNPYNYPQYQFFVYGTFPIFFTKSVAAVFHLDTYDRIYLLGRGLSALVDSLGILLLYFISRKLFPAGSRRVFLASLLYALCVLPLQLSHFFTVDTFLNFFILLTFTLLVYGQFFLAAVAFGFALSCKISAVTFIPIIGLFFLSRIFKTKKFLPLIAISFICLLIVLVVFRIFQPYSFSGLFTLNPQFIRNLQDLKNMASPQGAFPPSIQWFSKVPILYSSQNLFLWGLGLPLSFLFILSLANIKRKLPMVISFSLVWIAIIYIYQGTQFSHTMRYFLPIYPFICLVAGFISKKKSRNFIRTFVVLHFIWAILFISIYTRPHSRVQASEWIYQNLPSASKITNESWDDPLPLYLPGRDPYIYQGSMLDLYDADGPQKWQKLDPLIDSADFMFLTSNRLWGSIPLVPDKYPETSVFYQKLFAGNLNFLKLKEINSYPGIGLPFLGSCYYFGPTVYPGVQNSWFSVDRDCLYPGVFIRDDIAEEAFTVYDHPKVLIFARKDQ